MVERWRSMRRNRKEKGGRVEISYRKVGILKGKRRERDGVCVLVINCSDDGVPRLSLQPILAFTKTFKSTGTKMQQYMYLMQYSRLFS